MVILSKGRMSAILDKDEFTQEKVLKYAAEGEDDGTIKEA